MSSEPKRLYRSRNDRWLAGICGGIGTYFGLDPTLIRVLFVLFGLVVGGGFLLYILLWIIIPLEPDSLGKAVEAVETPEEDEEPEEGENS
jgi:phage shock protein C